MAWFSRGKKTALLNAPAHQNGVNGHSSAEERVQQIGRALLDASRANASGLLSKQYWSDKLMEWSMSDPKFKVQLFRFVDAFPMLSSPELIHEHLVDYLTQPGVKLPPGLSLGLGAGAFAKGILAKTMTGQIEGMAAKFIAGVDAKSALPMLEKLWKNRMAFSVDLLGEACVSEREATQYRGRYLDLIQTLPGYVREWKADELLERDHLGPIPRTNVSIKISSLSGKTDPIDFENTLEHSFESLRLLLEAAKANDVFINFDMEHHALKDLTIALFIRCMERVEFTGGIALQAYLRSGEEDAQQIIDFAKRSGRKVGVRLVKGAYWDFETIQADMNGWPVPVWSTKRETDACFERVSRQLIDAIPTRADEGGISLAIASHNLRSIAAALQHLESRGLPTNALELQMLHGMADPMKSAATDANIRIREYVPVGQMLPGMAYLVRRLLENTSNESWLKAGFLDGASAEDLLASPHSDRGMGLRHVSEGKDHVPEARATGKHALSDAPSGVSDEKPFFTEPMRDFANAAQRDGFAMAVRTATVQSIRIEEDASLATRAIDAAESAFPSWRDADSRSRAKYLIEVAKLMRHRRDELSALIVKENGKNWRNADADVCEAIDFCEYYARQSIALFEPKRLGRFAGELNLQFHQPRGVCVVIPPWNFPLAIAAGMVAAALVTGNTVVLKPAEQTPAIAKILCDLFAQAKLPKDVLTFLPGRGETIGAALVRDPRVAIVAFTGSSAVGLDILNAAAPESPFPVGATLASTADSATTTSRSRQASPQHLKRVICEMGGKNAIIVDASADLDEAVLGVRDSAFGFSGQKCSACSRAIVVDACYDLFLMRLIEATKDLVVGDPTKPGTDLGPVIDDDAANKIRGYIELGKAEGKLAYAAPASPLGERFIGPNIFTEIEPHHRLANEEIFGPVLSIIRARDFEHALQIANGSPYKLTGGVFSRTPKHLLQAAAEFRVGNLYLNRGITGALVGRQPFGGFGLSGVGSKAGGDAYLLQFVEPRIVTENTMRRGFAPDLAGE
jgi:RHH-type proline utilization regulon transcriptional repressor/proline dehydrogenase/delta 1-pyrroline-5-carboxylate dehydrogenase